MTDPGQVLDEQAGAALEADANYHRALIEALRQLLEHGSAPGWQLLEANAQRLQARSRTARPFRVLIFRGSGLQGWHRRLRDPAAALTARLTRLIAAGVAAPPALLQGRVASLPFAVWREVPGRPLPDFLAAAGGGGQLAPAAAHYEDALAAFGEALTRLYAGGLALAAPDPGAWRVEAPPERALRVVLAEPTALMSPWPWRRRRLDLDTWAAALNLDEPAAATLRRGAGNIPTSRH